MRQEENPQSGPRALAPTEVLPPERIGGARPPAQNWAPEYFEPLEAIGTNQSKGDFVEYLNLIRRRKFTILLITALGGLAAWGFASMQTPLYQARTSIEVQSMAESDSLYRIIDKEWQRGGGNVTAESYLETQLHILNSRAFQTRVLDKIRSAPRAVRPFEITKVRAFLANFGVKPPVALPGGLPPVNCSSETVENTRIVEIECQSPDPLFSADYADATGQEFIAYNLEVQSTTAKQTMEWLTGQLADMRSKVDQAKAKLDAYAAGSGVQFEANEPTTEKGALSDLQTQLATAHLQRINDQAAYEVALSFSKTNEATDDRQSAAQEQMLKLKNQLELLNLRYTPSAPQVEQVKSEIATLEKIMASQTVTNVSSLKSKYEASRLREDRLQEARAKQAEVVTAASKKGTEYDTLKRELERTTKLYEDLLQTATTVSLSTAMSGSSQIRVVDAAQPPATPFRPAVPRTAGLGVAAGFMLGLGLVFIAERANHRLRNPGETPYHLSLPELAVVPRFNPVAGIPGQVGAVRSLIRRIPPFRKAEPETAVLALSQEKPGPVVESFRGAVASLLAYRNQRKSAKRILATSASQGDGKSLVVSNLGITLAEIGYSVVLVDGDIRRPQLNHLFGLPNSWGLTTLVTDGRQLKTAPIETLVQKTKHENLSVLTAGPGASSVVRILHSRATEELFDRLAAEFDFVLVDSPPALEFSDARLLGRLVDGAVLVIRAGETTREAALLVRDRLMEDHLTVIGTILNRWDGHEAPGYSNYKYHEIPL